MSWRFDVAKDETNPELEEARRLLAEREQELATARTELEEAKKTGTKGEREEAEEEVDEAERATAEARDTLKGVVKESVNETLDEREARARVQETPTPDDLPEDTETNDPPIVEEEQAPKSRSFGDRFYGDE